MKIQYARDGRYVCGHMSMSSRATTHTDLVLRAKRRGIEYKVIHNASIMNAVACCGLQVLAEVFIVYFILYHNVEKC
jgi:hypothetical protein